MSKPLRLSPGEDLQIDETLCKLQENIILLGCSVEYFACRQFYLNPKSKHTIVLSSALCKYFLTTFFKHIFLILFEAQK